MACEEALRKYVAAFDGTRKPFSGTEQQLFDDLFHKSYSVKFKDGKRVDRAEVRNRHAGYFTEGYKATLLHFRKIGLECVDFQVLQENDYGERVIRLVCSVENGKLARAYHVDSFGSIARASCAGHFHRYNVIAKCQTNLKP